MESTPAHVLAASYFDGTHSRAHAVTLQLDGGQLHITGEGIQRVVALGDVQWPERTRHGMRVAHFKGGGAVQSADAAAWDAWSRSQGRHDSLVVRMQQSWRWVAASLVALVVMGVVVQQWGLPVASRALVAATPLSVDKSLGEATLAVIDDRLMRPSKLPVEEQARLRAALAQALGAMPAGSVPAWQLVFRKSRIGPNAFALPGGTLVMTDELVELVGRDEQVITAVLAHEMGHVRHRHGVRMLVQATVLSGLASYSREAEREADAEAVRLLKAAGISPMVMVTLFEKLDKNRKLRQPEADKGKPAQDKPGSDDPSATQDSWLGIAFASHPGDADRIRYFRQAAGK